MSEADPIETIVNGFGRIGMPYTRQAIEDPGLQLVGIGNRQPSVHDISERLRMDSVHHSFNEHTINAEDGVLMVDGTPIPVIDSLELRPALWRDYALGKLVLADCTGFFLDLPKAQKHLEAGADLVVLSSPAKDDAIPTIVMGVNDSAQAFERAAEQKVVAVSSCSTNCIAPILKVFNDNFKVDFASADVVHARTGSQPHLDGRGDATAARRSADNLVDASTGSDREIVRLIKGLPFDSHCTRTPVPDGSKARISFVINQTLEDADVIGELYRATADESLARIISLTEHDIYSGAVIGTEASSVIDLNSISVLPRGAGRTVVRLSAWFDNEWGYTARVRDVVKAVGSYV